METCAIDPTAPVSLLVVESPGFAPVFERLRIDYSCSGDVPLVIACNDRRLELSAVVGELLAAGADDAGHGRWADVPLADLCEHIVGGHHRYLRSELRRLLKLSRAVARQHAAVDARLSALCFVLRSLDADTDSHTAREEADLFPAATRLEARGGTVPPELERLINSLESEHRQTAVTLRQIRRLLDDYDGAAAHGDDHRVLIEGLAELERDTHRHVHEENNILFPRLRARTAA
ncbi:MAG TPA: DUF542 domain-containing protein [Gaiellales bacterium]|nr:DUF542 domain-containing protein [Gaiellales bacterium]